MKKRATLVLASALLFGCGGNVDISSGSTAGSGGGGGSTTGSTSTTSAQGGTTSQGGSGGALLGGTGGGTTTSEMGCSVVLDKGWFVDFAVDGGPTTEYTQYCDGPGDGMGPGAIMFHGKGGPGNFDIFACPETGISQPRISLNVDDPTVPDSVTILDVIDQSGTALHADTAATTFTAWGPEWTNVAGAFNGKVTGADGTVKVVTGTFLVCRRPDVYAP
ncbi:MAG: hypothetical protein U0441_06265 [Polyangiaceae bacterium]